MDGKDLPALPTMLGGSKEGNNNKKISPPTTARKPAPALLNEEGESGDGPPPSLSLGTHSDKNRVSSSCQDPLGNPAATGVCTTKIPPSLHYDNNPPSSMVNMTDEQLRTALDRWDGIEGEDGVTVGGILSSLSVWWKRTITNATTTTTRTTTESSAAVTTQQQQSSPPSSDSTPFSPARIISGAVACLCSATLGAGILSLPYAMAEAGLACGMALLVLSAIATSWSIRLLVQAMQVVVHSPTPPSTTNNNDNATMQQFQQQQPQQNEETTSYEDVVERCLGKQWRRVAEACMLIFCCGTAVAYVIAVGDIMQQAKLCHSKAVAKTLAWASVMVPLSMLRTMKSLECASSIGIASIATLVVAALFHYWEHPGEQAPQLEEEEEQKFFYWLKVMEVVVGGGDHHSIWVPTQGMLSILRACPIILFAFSCQVNVCAIFEELPGQQQSEQRQQQHQCEEQQSSPSPGTYKADIANEIKRDNSNQANSSSQSVQEDEIPPTTIEPSSNTTTTTINRLACSKFHRMNQVTWLAVGICALLYSSISIIALKDFGSQKMTPNILTSYNPESVMLVAFVGMTLAVTLAYPMNIFPARVTLLGLVRTLRQRRQQQQQQQQGQGQSAVDDDLADLEEPLLPPPGTDSPTTASTTKEDEDEAEQQTPRALSEVSDSTPVSDVVDNSAPGTDVVDTSNALVEHVLATLFLTGLSLCLALVAPNISVVFGLLGGTSSSVLGFVIPGLLGLETANAFYAENVEAAKTTRIVSIALVVSGAVVGIVTTAVTIYSTFAL